MSERVTIMRVGAATYGVGGVKERLPAAGLVPMNALEVLTWAEAMAEREAKRNRAAKEAKRKRTNFSFFVGTKGSFIGPTIVKYGGAKRRKYFCISDQRGLLEEDRSCANLRGKKAVC